MDFLMQIWQMVLGKMWTRLNNSKSLEFSSICLPAAQTASSKMMVQLNYHLFDTVSASTQENIHKGGLSVGVISTFRE